MFSHVSVLLLTVFGEDVTNMDDKSHDEGGLSLCLDFMSVMCVFERGGGGGSLCLSGRSVFGRGCLSPGWRALPQRGRTLSRARGLCQRVRGLCERARTLCLGVWVSIVVGGVSVQGAWLCVMETIAYYL